jgi:uncharacterized RDD family membrane protein YckC
MGSFPPDLEYDVIETPENVRLRRPLAGIGSRFLAGLYDTLVLVLVFFVLGLIALVAVVATGGWSAARQAIIIVAVLTAFLLYWGYFLLFEWLRNGQTPGKKSQKIRVARDGGEPVGFLDSAVRNILRVVDGLGGYMVAGLVMFLTRKCQRLGDLAAGTVVISEGMPDYSSQDKPVATERQWTPQALPGSLSQAGLSAEEYRILWRFHARSHELTDEARCHLAEKLMRPIVARRPGLLPAAASQLPWNDQLAWLLAYLKAPPAVGPAVKPPEAAAAPPPAEPMPGREGDL